MAVAVGFERVASALDALREAIPALPVVDTVPTLAVNDAESRRLLEEILVELRTLNARSS